MCYIIPMDNKTVKKAAYQIWSKAVQSGVKPPGRDRLAAMLKDQFGEVNKSNLNYWLSEWRKAYKQGDTPDSVTVQVGKPDEIHIGKELTKPMLQPPKGMQEVLDGLVETYIEQNRKFSELDDDIQKEKASMTVHAKLAYMRMLQDERKITLAQMEKVGLFEVQGKDYNIIFEEHYGESD